MAASKKTHLWSRPPIPESGDTDEADVYRAVGEALSRWERLEEQLAMLFIAFIGAGQDTDAARRAYGAILKTSDRREMMLAAAVAHFHEHPNPGLENDFKKIINTIGDASGRRNDIAHGIVRPYGMYFVVPEGRSETFLLFPSFASTKSTKLATPFILPDYAYTSEQITKFGIGFMNFIPEVFRVGREILRRAQQRPSQRPD